VRIDDFDISLAIGHIAALCLTAHQPVDEPAVALRPDGDQFDLRPDISVPISNWWRGISFILDYAARPLYRLYVARM
jgi:hypothetical protein